jgi:hypothetical protein
MKIAHQKHLGESIGFAAILFLMSIGIILLISLEVNNF